MGAELLRISHIVWLVRASALQKCPNDNLLATCMLLKNVWLVAAIMFSSGVGSTSGCWTTDITQITHTPAFSPFIVRDLIGVGLVVRNTY